MGDLSEFSPDIVRFLKNYRWRKIDPVPWTPWRKPLSQSKLALVSSAGLVPENEPLFDETIKGGDFSFREISSGIQADKLIFSHTSNVFDSDGIKQDPNIVFPIDRVIEIKRSGWIGAVNHRHLSFMGSITAPGRLIANSAPDAAALFVEDGVDIVMLIPV
ncbi:MAG: hypothetical protein JRI63_11735 [Deltaproteobacteria bacterium]|nr:hypothetical protein [Deltaproteobacteria bacterium]